VNRTGVVRGDLTCVGAPGGSEKGQGWVLLLGSGMKPLGVGAHPCYPDQHLEEGSGHVSEL
jgi:hypothetical protein